MKNSILKNKTLVLVALVALTMSACAKKNTSTVRVAGRAATVTASNNNGVVTNGNCSLNSPGRVYDSGANFYTSSNMSFEQRVKSFVSATMDPSLLGSIGGNISDKTGINLYASFKFDSSGNVDAAGSSFTMQIFDSYANQYYNGQLIEPYTITFSSATSGVINRQGRNFTIVFADEYGEITFAGQYTNSSSNITGNVSFKNYTSYNGSNVASGDLGTFAMYGCQLVGQ